MMRRILAVDDDHDILEILQFILEDSGYQVDTLSDGRHLMQKINEIHPDLILLDIMLGSLDGRELCKALKKDESTNNIPVIMISASHSVAKTLNQSGAPNDFIAKPFDINNLLNKVKTHLQAA
ncbi:response regulator [Mucilaginibacter pallidiroseus]|uniref:Response regulator n=2 Tax=Mucilaginibacter pallidiroseus TaxID=2599295 RepID=A0A563UDK4_9SPHI|nr:response regulator [Mucilaginibacter pallidiroseus]